MAMFPRRKKDDPTVEVEPATASETADDPSAVDESATEPAPSVGISTTSFRGLGVQQHPPRRTFTPPPAEAPQQTETVPGLKDNVLLRHALSELTSESKPQDLIHIG